MGLSGIVIAIVLIAAATSAAGCLSPANNKKFENVIGIDLGTTAYRVSAYMNGHIEIIPSHEGNRSTPSMVAFTDSERFIIGEAAKSQVAVNPQRTIFDVNRFLGRRFEDNDVQRDMKLVPYKVVNKDGKPHIKIQIKDGETKVLSPEEISAMFLTKIKETSEAFTGKKVTDAVVTLPAYCSDAQRQAARDAFLIAGYEGVTPIKEPVAAAHAYYLHNNPGPDNILVFDIGDTTFQVTIMERSSDFYDTLATNGDTRFGGDDFNQRIMEYLINLIKNKYGKDISNDNKALLKLRAEAERAKRVLINEHEVHVEIESLFDGVNLSERLTRARFEELNDDLFAKTMGHVTKAMEDAGLEKHQIDHIIIVGGNANIPKVQQLLRDYFDGRLEPMNSVNPDEVVAIGAAVIGQMLMDDIGRDLLC